MWSAVLSHRKACLRAVQARVLELLEDPKTTRKDIRREVAKVVTEVEKNGP